MVSILTIYEKLVFFMVTYKVFFFFTMLQVVLDYFNSV